VWQLSPFVPERVYRGILEPSLSSFHDGKQQKHHHSQSAALFQREIQPRIKRYFPVVPGGQNCFGMIFSVM
jgi:hypothetical protein